MMYEINGMSLRKYCLKNGVNYFSVYQRMLDKCETPEEAIKNIKPIKNMMGNQDTTFAKFKEFLIINFVG